MGGSTSAGLAPAGLALAAMQLKEPRYLQVAKALGEHYYDRFVRVGLTCGGPGDVLQAPDSESGAALLDSFMTLFEATRDRVWIDRAHAGARGYFQQRNKLEEVLTQLTVEWKPLVLVAPEAREQQIFYECMLGRYRTDRDWTAGVTLVVPDGTNIYNDVVRQRMVSGSGDPSSGKLHDYTGTGSLLVGADGIYSFIGPARAVKLNGQELAEIREKPVEVPLKKGLYTIEVMADEKYTSLASITIIDPRSRQRLAINEGRLPAGVL